jgi:membrane-associated phospholipid phosphatase
MVLGSSRRPTLVGLVVWFVLISGYVQAQSPPQKSPQDSRPSTSMAIDDGESHVTLGALPKNLLEDQEAFWTSPFRMRTGNLSFLVPATFASAFLVGSDTAAETHLPKATATVSRAATASNAGMAALLGAGGGLFLWGQIHQNEHQRETGFLAGEAAIDAYIDATAFKYVAGRERPFVGDGRGRFFQAGDSFPSDTSAVSWAAASVIAHEYPGPLTKLLAYGTAGAVSAARVVGHKHWVADAVLGSALGWYLGQQIYRAHSAGHEIDASNWGTFEKDPDDEGRDPSYMGSTFVPLDSWVYPALDRLEALGYLPTLVQAIRPMARMECARLTLEAQEEAGYPEVSNNESARAIAALRTEFAVELAKLEGAANVGIELQSVYARATQISGRPLRDSFHFAQTIYDDYGRPYGQGLNGILGFSGRAEAGPVAFYVQGEYQHSAAIASYSPATQQAIANADQLPLNSVPAFPSANQFRPIEAYVALNIANWQVSFGQQSAWWGPDYGSSLMWSNNAQAMPMLRFGRVTPFQLPGLLAWLGKIRNQFFVGRVGGYYFLRGPYPEFPLVGNGYRTVNPQPYTWGDKLGLKMTPNFEIGVTLTVMFAGQGRPATLATWLHTFSTRGNAQAVDPGKRFNGINFSYRIPGLRNWLVLYADGMANDEPNPIAYPTVSAWNPGLYFPQLPKLPNLDLRVEGIYTNIPGYPGVGPYYFNERYADGYRTYGQIIGSWVGRQGDAIQAWSTYWFSAQNKIQVAYRRQWNDKVFLEGGGLTDVSTTVDWLLRRDIQVSAVAQYERWNFPLVSPVPNKNMTVGLQVTFWPAHNPVKGRPDHSQAATP